MVQQVRYAGVEAGGTTWVIAVADGCPTNIVDRAEFPTSTPEKVLGQVVEWLSSRRFDCLGIASFGPIDLHRATSDKWGYITTTPKAGWRNTDILGPLKAGLGLSEQFPVAFDTDVNAPAFAEYMAARDDGFEFSSCAYITVGTGVGIGLVINGAPLRGMLHGEGGHVCVPRLAGDDKVSGISSGSGVGTGSAWAGVEAMCNSSALAQRAGCSAEELARIPDDDPLWDTAAHYLGALCANMILLVSPERIVLSGGVLKRSILFDKVRSKTLEYLNGYIDVPRLKNLEACRELIVPSRWKNDAGIIGALFLAKRVHDDRREGNMGRQFRKFGSAWAAMPRRKEVSFSSTTMVVEE
eukprot:CAMPEP_0172689232 /NCGR_PEP_ID=MMETSP1074-20121228/22996_1 /TAXON_ID=2916 /ORGANISM="Ceratium fusus, Strain PA161109" /LENGTH=353 /DNA_ID=CAMNT_0013509003 /DNA_START=57 /DNA_END=1115 /DNA_ORIENTATION=-